MATESSTVAGQPEPTSVTQPLSSRFVCDLAVSSGFELAGVVPFDAEHDFNRFHSWSQRGLAGDLTYLTDHRGQLRSNPDGLLPGARSIVCVGLLYNGPQPYSNQFNDIDRGWISRYAWGDDYHHVIRERLLQFAHRLSGHAEFRWRACVDTAPLLERSYANRAGLGWIGKNTCLINQELGSWFFLGELLTTLEIASSESSLAPDRCGTCTRCIEACPTQAIVPSPDGRYELDARLCISYFTIERRGPVPEQHRAAVGNNIFGCDICQDVCPWNAPRRAGRSTEPAFSPRPPDGGFAPSLERMADLSQDEFRQMFRDSPISRAKYSGFLRNVATAMGNSGNVDFVTPLQRLASSDDPVVSQTANWAIGQLKTSS